MEEGEGIEPLPLQTPPGSNRIADHLAAPSRMEDPESDSISLLPFKRPDYFNPLPLRSGQHGAWVMVEMSGIEPESTETHFGDTQCRTHLIPKSWRRGRKSNPRSLAYET